MTTRIFAHGVSIQRNAKLKKGGHPLEPVILVKKPGQQILAFEAIIRDEDGKEVCRVIYQPHQPRDGAHLWVETELKVEVITELEPESSGADE